MRLVRLFFAGHLLALSFGLGGLLIALRAPERWSHNHLALQIYAFGMRYGGSVHILFGLLTMLTLGLLTIGARRTLTFLVTTVAISLSSELIGTSTGWPFGNYAYTSGLGLKILGRVPFTIPLSWFYMGFASYLLATRLLLRRRATTSFWPPIFLGTYFLVVWDLVLDPAMAHPSLTARFWVWERSGPYFGMPIQNFAGWAATALLFMTVSRWLWHTGLTRQELQSRIPLGVYLANIGFAAALSASVGLWIPVALALLLGVLPAVLGSFLPATPTPPRGSPRPAHRATSPTPPRSTPVSEHIARQLLRLTSQLLTRRLDVQITGQAHIPRTGPVILACRHYHHLYDALLLMAHSPRPLSFLVALDWTVTSGQRQVMERLCTLAGWPIIARPERVLRGNSAYHASELPARVVQGLRDAHRRLCAGEALVVFPEGFPTIDPHWTPKQHDHDTVPFRAGVVWLAQRAARTLGHPVPIVPVGLAYTHHRRWHVALRIGTPLTVTPQDDPERLRATLESQVQSLSAFPPSFTLEPVQQLGQGEAQ